MPKKRNLFERAPIMVVDTSAITRLCAPISDTLLRKDHEGEIYFDVLLEAADEGLIHLVIPDTTVFQSTGINPKNWQQVDKFFTHEDKPVLHFQHALLVPLFRDIEKGRHANTELKFTEGIGHIRTVARLQKAGWEAGGDFSELDAYKATFPSDFADPILRQLTHALSNKTIKSCLLAEDRDCLHKMATEPSRGPVAAVSIAGFFEALEKHHLLPQLGFLKTTTADMITADINASQDQMNALDETRHSLHLIPPYDKAPGFGAHSSSALVHNFSDSMGDWLESRKHLQEQETLRSERRFENLVNAFANRLQHLTAEQKDAPAMKSTTSTQRHLRGGLEAGNTNHGRS